MAQKPRVAVVTGANRGIGLEVAKGLCQELKENGIVYIATKDEGQGKAAVEMLKNYKCKPIFYKLNVTNIYEAEDLRYDLKDRHGGLDILVNNAAINYPANSPVPFNEQAEEIMKVNFYFALHLTSMLWGVVRPYARIVNVVCGGAGNISLIKSQKIKSRISDPVISFRRLTILMNEYLQAVENGTHIEQGWPESPYIVSKMGVVALTSYQQYYFDKRQRKERIIVNCVNPGNVKTRLSEFKGTLTPEEGAKPIIKLALLPPKLKSPKGKFVWSDLSILDWRSGIFYEDENLYKLYKINY